MQEGCIQDDLCKIASAGPYIALTRPMDGMHLSLENVVFIDSATHCKQPALIDQPGSHSDTKKPFA